MKMKPKTRRSNQRTEAFKQSAGGKDILVLVTKMFNEILWKLETMYKVLFLQNS